MKIAILTVGSRGDIEPYLALATGLERAGHEVTIAAPAQYAGWIGSFGVEVFATRFDTGGFMAGRRQDAGPLSQNPTEQAVGVIDDYAAACKGADLILQTSVAWGGVEIAAATGAAVAFAHAFPATPTREFPAFLLSWRGSLGGAYNFWTQRVAQRIAWAIFGKTLNVWRSRQGLPRLRSYPEMVSPAQAAGSPTLYPYSPAVLPKPADWPETDHVTGYWLLRAPADWELPRDLRDFLDSGPPPVLFGFGSMTGRNPQKRTREVVRALELSGHRGVIVTGGGGALTRIDAPSSVMFIDNAPFSRLFPRMAAVVHHGGAGTTATALRAGVPSIMMPVGFDQFAWAQIIERLGVGVDGGRMSRLNAERLSRSIAKAINDEGMRRRVADLANQIEGEDGIARAVAILERHAASFFARQHNRQRRLKD
jgi:sterol 3beta-glucosyltransferase